MNLQIYSTCGLFLTIYDPLQVKLRQRRNGWKEWVQEASPAQAYSSREMKSDNL